MTLGASVLRLRRVRWHHGVLSDLYVFDVHTTAWTQVVHSGIAPPARAGATACALGPVPPHIVVFGGKLDTPLRRVQLLDTASNTWTKPAAHGQPPIARYYHTACFVKGSMLVFGGNDGSACLGDLHVLNVETWTWSQPETSGATPAARCGHSGTLVNKLWFVIGGVGDAPNNAFNALELNDVWVLDTEAWAWWRPDVNPVLPPLAYHTAALTGDKIFLFGGSSKDMLYNDVMMLDTTSSAWKVVQEGAAAKLPCRRRHSASRGSGTRILVFGGWDGARTCGELLELETSDWIRSDNVPRGRAPRRGQRWHRRRRRRRRRRRHARALRQRHAGGAAATRGGGGQRRRRHQRPRRLRERGGRAHD